MLAALVFGLVLTCLASTSKARAQQYAYPIPWPKSGGGTIVAVPSRDAVVRVYHSTSSPQGTGWDTPFTGAPEMVVDPAPAGEPIIYRAPPTTAVADQDDMFIFLSTSELVISAADDERYNPGSPDRLFFFPATSGTYRGTEFYGHCSAGWFANRIRIFNPNAATLTAMVYGWSGTDWMSVGTLDVAADDVGVFDPPATYPDTAYKVVTTMDALVLEGYMADNASLPAVDVGTGAVTGNDLWGYGHGYDIRATSDLDYTIDVRPEASPTWTRVDSGTLLANARLMGLVPGAPTTFSRGTSEVTTGSYIRIRTTRGRAWAIMGTRENAWNGYLIPAQSEGSCVFGATFYTTGTARTLAVLPNARTTVTIFDESSGAMLDEYTSTGAWEVHHFYDGAAQRVEFTDGPGAVMLVGLGAGTACTVAGAGTGNCGILEGGYSVPPLGFQCSGSASSLTECSFAPTTCTTPPPPTMGMDGGVVATDGGMTGTDGGMTGSDSGVVGDDGGVVVMSDGSTPDASGPRPDSGGVGGGSPGDGCGCHVVGPKRVHESTAWVLLLGLGVAAARRRRARGGAGA